ncbi:MAG: NUMOD4 motif-containing HNH endonuclease [Flavobacteriales bacterium]|nr:NUMOD4 motif-containing HNH endonuclease [Flavobacteriales bacterium]
MNSDLWKESWKAIEFSEDISDNEKYEISNYGRVRSLKPRTKGKVLKLSKTNGYEKLSIKKKDGKQTGRYIHKLVAENFVEGHSNEKKFVVHKDHDRLNNKAHNLQWVSSKEVVAHDNVKKGNPADRRKPTNQKLNEGIVKILKKKLNDPNRKTRMKMLAKQYGISEMQLYRIKVGENWGWVKPDGD